MIVAVSTNLNVSDSNLVIGFVEMGMVNKDYLLSNR